MQTSSQSHSATDSGGMINNQFNLDCSLFGMTMDQLEFDFYGNYDSN